MSASSPAGGINALTFEQLRSMGMSPTQAARVLAARDVRGGFTETDQIDQIPGLSDEFRTMLHAELGAGS